MSIAAEIAVTCAREVRRNLRSAKGLIATLLFTMGGGVAVLAMLRFKTVLDEAGVAQAPPEVREQARAQAWRAALMRMYDDDTRVVDYLMPSPSILVALYTATLMFLPALVILIGYDQLAGDLQYRTLRYTAVRAHRSSLVIGKVLAIWLVVCAISLLVNALAWGGLLVGGDASAAIVLRFGLHFWVMTAVFAAAYAGLVSLVSSWFKTPTLALMTTAAISFALFLVRQVLTHWPDLPRWLASVRYAIPGTWEQHLLSPRLQDFGLGMLVCLGFGALCTAGACVTLARRDV
jgi:hypothetical protein